MSEVIIIEAKVDTGNSAADLQAAEKGIEGVSEATNKLSSSTKAFLKEQRALADPTNENKIAAIDAKFKALNDTVEAGGLTFKDTAQAIKKYQDIAIQAGENSPIAEQAIKRAGDLKDQLRSVGEQVSRVGDGAKNMQAALQLGGVVVSGYTAFQSVLAMVGSENEDLLKIITKLQAAQGALAAIEQVRSALEKESFLMLKAKNLQLQIQEKGYRKLFATLLTNPMVAFTAVAVGLVTWISNLTQSTDKYNEAVKRNQKEMERINELFELTTKVISARYDNEIALARAAGKETFELEKEKTQALITATELRIKAIQNQRNEEREAFEEAWSNAQQVAAAFNLQSLLEGKDADFKKRQAKLRKDEIEADINLKQLRTQLEVIGIEQVNAANEKSKKLAEDKARVEEEARKKREADRKAFFEDDLEVQEVLGKKHVEDLDKRNQALFDANNKAFEQEQALNALREQEAEQRLQNDLDRANRRIGIADMEVQAIASLSRSLFEITNNLGRQDEASKLQRAKRQFNITKAVNIAEAAIDGAKAVTRAIAQFGPPPSPLGIAGIISAGAITGLQIAAIASRRFEGGGGSAPSLPSTGTPGGGASQVIPRQDTTTQVAPLVGQVVVLESDNMTSTQQRLRLIEERSTI